jgi:hypothetical protein
LYSSLGIHYFSAFLQKKDGAGAAPQEDWARRWKERLEQLLSTGVKAPELRHMFQELVFSQAAVTRVPRAARQQFLERSASHLVSKAYFEYVEQISIDNLPMRD